MKGLIWCCRSNVAYGITQWEVSWSNKTKPNKKRDIEDTAIVREICIIVQDLFFFQQNLKNVSQEKISVINGLFSAVVLLCNM